MCSSVTFKVHLTVCSVIYLLVIGACITSLNHDYYNWTCEDIHTMPMIELQNCTFQNPKGEIVNETTPLVCDILSRVIPYHSYIRYTLYIHSKLTFQIMSNKNYSKDDEQLSHTSSGDTTKAHVFNSSKQCMPTKDIKWVKNKNTDKEDGTETISLCLGYMQVIMEKLDLKEKWPNATERAYSIDAYFLLSVFDTFYLEVDLKPIVPIAIIDVDCNCWNQPTRDSSCIQSTYILEDILSMNTSINPMGPGDYWNMLKTTYIRKLGGVAQEINVDVNRELASILNMTYLTVVSQHTNLVKAHIAGNHWFHFEMVLPKLDSLRILEMPNNQMTFMDPGNLHNVPNLLTLNLASNNLSYIPESLSELRNLSNLDISGNTYISSYMQNREKLEHALKQLYKLKVLNVSNIQMNNLSVLYSVIGFNHDNATAQLDVLNISYCRLLTLESEDLFKKQHSLKILDLSGNKLITIPTAIVLGLSQLTHLHLADNLLRNGLHLKLGMFHLELLNLSSNFLQEPSGILASGAVHLLDVTRNHVHDWKDPNIFLLGSTPWLSTLLLLKNNITSVSRLMGSTLDGLEAVDLGGNPINCDDCRTPDFQRWLRNSSINIINNIITCKQPPKNSGKPVVDVKFNSSLCHLNPILEVLNYGMVLGLPLGSIFILASMFGGTIYRYRFELTYILKRGILWKKKNHSKMQHHDYDAFVSYSRCDRSWIIDKLSPNLEKAAEKYKLCIHERDFPLGSFIMENIENSLHRSRHIIVVLSPSFVISQWCQWELDMANHKLFEDDREFLILVELERLDRQKIPRRLKFLLDTQTYLEWPQSNMPSLADENVLWNRLKAALGRSNYQNNETSPLIPIN